MLNTKRLQEIAKNAADSILALDEGETVCTSDHIRKVVTEEEFHELGSSPEMFELDRAVCRLVEEGGARLDSSQWYGVAMGMPWFCPAVLRKGAPSLGELASVSPVRVSVEQRRKAAWEPVWEGEAVEEDPGAMSFEFQASVAGKERDFWLRRSGNAYGILVHCEEGINGPGWAPIARAPFGEWTESEEILPEGPYRFLVTLGEPYASAAATEG